MSLKPLREVGIEPVSENLSILLRALQGQYFAMSFFLTDLGDSRISFEAPFLIKN